MNKTEAETIARAINIHRPDWPIRQIVTIIGRDHQHRMRQDVAIALTAAALDPESRTPARINEDDFIGWKLAAIAAGVLSLDPADKPTPRPPRAAEACKIHAGGWRNHCAGCAADAKAHQETTDA